MEKRWWLLSAEQARKLDLAAGGIEKVLATYHEVHALQPIIDNDRELIRPAAVSIANEHIAALFEGALLLRPKPEIVEALDRRIQPDAHPAAWPFAQILVAACSRIASGADLHA